MAQHDESVEVIITTKPEDIVRYLKGLLRTGATAAHLPTEPDLAELLCPINTCPGLSEQERFIRAERALKAAVDRTGERPALYLTNLLGLSPGSREQPLGRRYELAGAAFKISDRTARTAKYRDRMLGYLAQAIYDPQEN